MSAASDLADQLATKLQDAQPEVWKSAILTARLDNLGILAITIFFMLALVVLGVALIREYKDIEAKSKRNFYDDGSGWLVGGVASFVLAGLLGIVLLNVWHWIALFDPQLYLAHRAIVKLLQ